jgi:hypothetical protein
VPPACYAGACAATSVRLDLGECALACYVGACAATSVRLDLGESSRKIGGVGGGERTSGEGNKNLESLLNRSHLSYKSRGFQVGAFAGVGCKNQTQVGGAPTQEVGGVK